MSRLQPYDTTDRHTQSITVTIHISGDQHVQVDSHGGRGQGSNIAVLADHIAVYAYDPRALRTYAEAWIDGGYIANHRLPEKAEPPDTKPEYAPGVIVRAHGHDHVEHAYDQAREQMVLRIGQMRWMVHDRESYRSMTAAWRQAKDIGKIVLPYHDRRLFNAPVPEPTRVRGRMQRTGPGE